MMKKGGTTAGVWNSFCQVADGLKQRGWQPLSSQQRDEPQADSCTASGPQWTQHYSRRIFHHSSRPARTCSDSCGLRFCLRALLVANQLVPSLPASDVCYVLVSPRKMKSAWSACPELLFRENWFVKADFADVGHDAGLEEVEGIPSVDLAFNLSGPLDLVFWIWAPESVTTAQEVHRCPARCLCFRTTVRCMFLQLEKVPPVPVETTNF